VSGSGISWAISAPGSRQITTPAPHYTSFLQAGCPSCRPTNSVKALMGVDNQSEISFFGPSGDIAMATKFCWFSCMGVAGWANVGLCRASNFLRSD